MLTEFPSHYGSRSTDLWAALKPWFNKVSIPLWFSLNSVPYWPRQKSLVSIPLWFSLNEGSRQEGILQISRFHPTMVLAQHGNIVSLFQCNGGFHPTMVLAQLVKYNEDEETVTVFPSHYGSRSTRSGKRSMIMMKCVSIPLWFSLNSLYYKNYTGLQGAKSNLLAKISREDESEKHERKNVESSLRSREG